MNKIIYSRKVKEYDVVMYQTKFYYDIVLLSDITTLAFYKLFNHIDSKIIRKSIFGKPLMIVEMIDAEEGLDIATRKFHDFIKVIGGKIK